jgi:hypothetical protein
VVRWPGPHAQHGARCGLGQREAQPRRGAGVAARPRHERVCGGPALARRPPSPTARGVLPPPSARERTAPAARPRPGAVARPGAALTAPVLARFPVARQPPSPAALARTRLSGAGPSAATTRRHGLARACDHGAAHGHGNRRHGHGLVRGAQPAQSCGGPGPCSGATSTARPVARSACAAGGPSARGCAAPTRAQHCWSGARKGDGHKMLLRSPDEIVLGENHILPCFVLSSLRQSMEDRFLLMRRWHQ